MGLENQDGFNVFPTTIRLDESLISPSREIRKWKIPVLMKRELSVEDFHVMCYNIF